MEILWFSVSSDQVEGGRSVIDGQHNPDSINNLVCDSQHEETSFRYREN